MIPPSFWAFRNEAPKEKKRKKERNAHVQQTWIVSLRRHMKPFQAAFTGKLDNSLNRSFMISASRVYDKEQITKNLELWRGKKQVSNFKKVF